MDAQFWTNFVKLFVQLISKFQPKSYRVSRIELLIKCREFCEVPSEVDRKIESELNAHLYGNGRIVPNEYLKAAKKSVNPEMVLDLYPKAWNFLVFPSEGGVSLRSDLSTREIRKKFERNLFLLWLFIGAWLCFVVRYPLFSFFRDFAHLMNITPFNDFIFGCIYFIILSLCMGVGFVMSIKIGALDELTELGVLSPPPTPSTASQA